MKKGFIWSLFSEDGAVSSKRFAGIICTVFLCVTMLIDTATHGEYKPSEMLVDAVTMIAISSLGISTVQTIFKKKDESV
jgi:hypothetical protein